MTAPLTLFAPAPLGLEALLAAEITSLGGARVRAARAGVSFEGPLETAYRVCLWSRLASRVLVRIAEVPAGSPEELYDSVYALAWEDHMNVDGTLAVDFTASRSPITHTKYGALKVKDAIVDRFRDRTGTRPNVDVVAPDLRINVAARVRSAVISIDLAGEPLHRRGYREQGVQVAAPLKETLASAVLLFAGWPKIAQENGPLVDPMCGSGTLAVEGAMIAGDRAPGLLRARWGFDRWLGHDADTWDDLLAQADDRAEE
ncbi:MAG: THUMP domain-containing protein, partial [Coriobacteriia bacterium]